MSFDSPEQSTLRGPEYVFTIRLPSPAPTACVNREDGPDYYRDRRV